jgi:TDG/mug DNA glycosylase family protein
MLAGVPPPTPADLVAARDRVLPDILGPGLRVLFCGINPGLWSAAVGHHFARPGNRFWPTLHRAGFTPRQLRPDEQAQLPGYRLGLTNLAPRATARADELRPAELLAGVALLHDKLARHRPEWLAVLGIGAYRTGFGQPRAALGEQPEPVGQTRIWVLPNPSGLNGAFPPDRLAAQFTRLRERVALPDARG